MKKESIEFEKKIASYKDHLDLFSHFESDASFDGIKKAIDLEFDELKAIGDEKDWTEEDYIELTLAMDDLLNKLEEILLTKEYKNVFNLSVYLYEKLLMMKNLPHIDLHTALISRKMLTIWQDCYRLGDLELKQVISSWSATNEKSDHLGWKKEFSALNK